MMPETPEEQEARIEKELQTFLNREGIDAYFGVEDFVLARFIMEAGQSVGAVVSHVVKLRR